MRQQGGHNNSLKAPWEGLPQSQEQSPSKYILVTIKLWQVRRGTIGWVVPTRGRDESPDPSQSPTAASVTHCHKSYHQCDLATQESGAPTYLPPHMLSLLPYNASSTASSPTASLCATNPCSLPEHYYHSTPFKLGTWGSYPCCLLCYCIHVLCTPVQSENKWLMNYLYVTGG